MMEIPAFALLCSLCAAAFSAGAVHRAHLGYWLGGLLLFVALCAPFTPWARAGVVLTVEPQQFAGALALAGFLLLKSPGRAGISVFLGGAAAALWFVALTAQGLPPALGLSLATILPLAALLGAIHRPGFAAARYREEALVIVLVLALAVALVPGALDGWRSAVGLKAVEVTPTTEAVAAGGQTALLVAGLFIILGCIYASWKHR